jgi:hypothetical protein
VDDTDAAIDELFSGALDEFVARRDALARARRDGGDRAGAAAVRALRKPSPAAWAVNQLARTDARTLHDIYAAGDRVRNAFGDSEELGEAMREAQRVVNTAARHAAELLTDARRLTETQRERIAATLLALAADVEHRDTARAGLLLDDLEPPAFGLGGDGPDPAVVARTATARQQRDRRATARANAETAVADAERKLRQAIERTDDAARRADRLARDAAQAARDADAARAAVDAAEAAVTSARQRLDDLA